MTADEANALHEEMATAWQQCRNPNWDGFGAHAVSTGALRDAHRFLESLPCGCPAPSIGAEPDGAITLEWHGAARRTLSVSVSDDGQLHFAALFGPSRVWGTEALAGNIAKTILQLIERLYRG